VWFLPFELATFRACPAATLHRKLRPVFTAELFANAFRLGCKDIGVHDPTRLELRDEVTRTRVGANMA